jgi:hypothetical protein
MVPFRWQKEEFKKAKIKKARVASMVVLACNPVPGRVRQEDCKLKASLGFIVRACLKISKE